MNIQQLVENKKTLDYQAICTALIQIFGVEAKINWESVLPAQQQQDYFGGEALRLIADHPILSKQKDIRPICLKKGNTSQMLFMYVSLKDATLPKKDIQEIGKKFISGGDANRYIIWFFGNTENSQLKVVLSGKEGKKVVLKTLPFGVNQPYYKTYNFILTEVNTQVNQLFVEPTELWRALWKAFDISVVNRNFYKEIKAAFDDLMQKELPQGTTLFYTPEEKVQFAIRLMGRVIFCWFLKRKGIIKEDVLASKVVKDKDSYYHDLLSVLFFEVFNTATKDRKAGLPPSIAHYPFLNGGLFEAQSNDFKGNTKLTISNDWFYRLFALTLEKYNFTVDENSSNNAEIAIDPEMLGRIFENLLAEQNPETGESARKATGSFYTPREIVDYMVEQSIIEYLKTSLGAEEIVEAPLQENLFGVVPLQQLSLPKVINKDLPENWEEMLADFVHTLILPKDLQKHEKDLNKALNQIKVLDPACGSGAFPMGVLQKLVALKQVLRPNEKPYQLKLSTIQQSIYGIDIQAMAVELSRLRCWLSLVVDEEVENIKPLPYLDFKFVCADSLVDVPHFSGKNDPKLQELLKDFQRETEAYFDCAAEKKVQRKKALIHIVEKIIQYNSDLITKHNTEISKEAGEKSRKHAATKLNMNLEESKSEPVIVAENETNYKKKNNPREKNAEILVQSKLLWESFKNIFEGKKVGFFNVEYFFPAAKEGFDVVIGNPPYGAKLSSEKKKYFIENYQHQDYQLDTYLLFIERALALMKVRGINAFIIPNTWLINLKLQKIRRFVIEENTILSIVHYHKNVFENVVVDTQIVIFKKGKNNHHLVNILEYKSIEDQIHTQINQDKWKSLAGQPINIFIDKQTQDIIDTIKKDSKLLSEVCDVVIGMKPYQVGKGKPKQTQEIVNNRAFDAEYQVDDSYRALLRGKDINKYVTLWDGRRWIKYGDYLAEPRYSANFDLPAKIVIRQTSDSLIATLDTQKFVCMNNLHIVNPKHEQYDLKYILAIINSKLMNFYYETLNPEKGEVLAEVKKEHVEKLLIKEIDKAAQQPFIILVEYLLYIKSNKDEMYQNVSNNLIIKYLEDIIDGMVLELYFEEEMRVKNIHIITLVEKELQKCSSEQISENIYAFYRAVSHPDSEIRNRILMFPLASPYMLKPILQS